MTTPDLIGIVSEETICLTGSGRAGRVPPGAYPVVPIDGADEAGTVWLTVANELVAVHHADPHVTYAKPGDPFHSPDLPPEALEGFVVGTCGHRVAGSEYRAGLTTCEHCA